MTNTNSNKHKNLVLPAEDRELFFQASLDQSYNSVVITDANVRIIYANPSFEKMTGYTLSELVGKSPKVLQGPLTDKEVIKEMGISIRAGAYFEGSTINYTKTGSPYNVEWIISPIKDPSGTIEYFISVQKNITADIRTQQERNLLAKALNDSPDCVVITDVENKIVFVNAGFTQLTGYQQEEVLGKTPSFLWSTLPDRSCNQSYVASNSIKHFNLDESNLGKDGSLFYVDLSITRILDNVGKVTHYVSFSKDSTDRLKREFALKDLASKDGLTGLLNRRSGEQLLKQYDDQKQLSKRLLCLIIIDIDNFKGINDTFGHAIGDHVLKTCSKLLENQARSTDSVIRWGGEEFLIIVPDSKLQDALEFAERIRKALAEHTVSDVGHVTASFGVADLQLDEGTKNLLNRADKALYQAKLNGKNCVKPAN